jgi:hypothetical protein
MTMIADALLNLRPGAQWKVVGDQIEWLDNTQTEPTRQEILEEVARIEENIQATEYQRKRQREYPPLSELADALYHQQNGDDTKMTAYLAKCEAVKQKYPKE